jgi:hypothetical protein
MDTDANRDPPSSQVVMLIEREARVITRSASTGGSDSRVERLVGERSLARRRVASRRRERLVIPVQPRFVVAPSTPQ